MNRLALRGVGGGVGTTALLCGLALALHEQGARVLLIDCSPEDMARLHFGDGLDNRSGWARAELDGSPWNEALQIQPNLHVLPYGRLTSEENYRIEQHLQERPDYWSSRCKQLRPFHDWVLFDLPPRCGSWPTIVSTDGRADLLIDVATPTPDCHALLHRHADKRADLLLINRYSPASQLQRDLALLWRTAYSPRYSPQFVHEDEAVPEALAHKLPVGLHAPASQAASDLRNLALWCMARARSRQGGDRA